ncbi:hypothetical protein B9Z55_018220 [Caenorhabditis nigoni]|nr:hypothetical protein B9Z55_018220 [Caenorhabditis nigoni]
MNKAILLMLIFASTAHSCLKVRSGDYEFPIENCQCPPFKLYSMNDFISTNEGGKYLKNQQTWNPTIGFNPEYPCSYNVQCDPIAGVSSYYSMFFRSNGSPIYINRVINNQTVFVEQPRSIGSLDCRLHTDGTHQWYFHDYPLFDYGFACVADVDSCNCPPIKIDDGVVVTPRDPSALDQCSLYTARCTNVSLWQMLRSTDAVLLAGGIYGEYYGIFEELMCVKEEDSTFEWYFANKQLKDLSIECNTLNAAFGEGRACDCGPFPKINNSGDLEKYDRKGEYKGVPIGANSWTASCKFYMECEKGYSAVVFSANYDPIILTGNYITCTYNPLTNWIFAWFVNSIRVVSPAGAFLIFSSTSHSCWVRQPKSATPPTTSSTPPPIPIGDCKCPPLKMYSMNDYISNNEGGKYLKNQQSWNPTIGVDKDLCTFNVQCDPIPGVPNYYTVAFRSNGSPIYVSLKIRKRSLKNKCVQINRVINNKNTFVEQPRYIGSLDCRPHTDGTHQWYFHDYPVFDLGFACVADVHSFKCPIIKIGDKVNFTERDPWARQGSLYISECPDNLYPMLHSTDAYITTGGARKPESGIFEELFCVKVNDTAFAWYFANKQLNSVWFECHSLEEVFGAGSKCVCGAFPQINNRNDLEKYDRKGEYKDVQIGANNWSASCKFNMECEKGYTAVVFSANYDPIILTGNYITCTYNPLSNWLRAWFVNSVRVVNPAGACLLLPQTP